MGKLTEEQLASLGEAFNAREIERAGNRSRVIAMASRMVDTLEDKDPNMMEAHREPNIEPKLSSAPDEIPHFNWKASIGDGMVCRTGDFGSLLVDQWSNERPGQIANAAFYAGVLAAKAGLVDVDAFHRDTEVRETAGFVPEQQVVEGAIKAPVTHPTEPHIVE